MPHPLFEMRSEKEIGCIGNWIEQRLPYGQFGGLCYEIRSDHESKNDNITHERRGGDKQSSEHPVPNCGRGLLGHIIGNLLIGVEHDFLEQSLKDGSPEILLIEALEHLLSYSCIDIGIKIETMLDREDKEIGQSPEQPYRAFDDRRHIHGADDQNTHIASKEPPGSVDCDQQQKHVHHDPDHHLGKQRKNAFYRHILRRDPYPF